MDPNNAALHRLHILTHQLSAQPVAAASEHNTLERATEQSHVDLSTLLCPEAVHALRDTTRQVTLDEWKSMKGSQVGISPLFKVTQDRIDAFAVTTLDPQWIHTRDAGTLGSPFGGPIAHGFLGVALMPFLVAQATPSIKGAKMGVNYGIEKLRFVSPVPVGANIRARVRLQEVKEIDGGKGIQNTLLVNVEVEGREKPAITIVWLTRAYF